MPLPRMISYCVRGASIVMIMCELLQCFFFLLTGWKYAAHSDRLG